LEEQDYRARLIAAGFAQVELEPTRIYNVEDTRQFLTAPGIDVDAVAEQVKDKFVSAFIRGTKQKTTAAGRLLLQPSQPGFENLATFFNSVRKRKLHRLGVGLNAMILPIPRALLFFADIAAGYL
jgi:hypothetical protein